MNATRLVPHPTLIEKPDEECVALIFCATSIDVNVQIKSGYSQIERDDIDRRVHDSTNPRGPSWRWVEN